MAQTVQRTRETTSRNGQAVQKTTEVDDPNYAANHTSDVAARIVWFIGGILLAVLALRFLLSLFGANTTNAFANFIYKVSYPFVVPFFNLFSYDSINNGVSHFEVYTLVAIVIYALVIAGLARLVTIARD